MAPDETTGALGQGRNEVLEEVLAGYLDRLNAGEILDREEVLREHPGLGEQLLERLEVFQKIGEAGEPGPTLGALGDYRLLRRVGRGGMGVVYEAWQESMDRRVALKVLPGGLLGDLKLVARFEREAKIAGKLQHPHIVGVHGMGVDANTPYYAMEFVEGETLAQVLARLRADEKKGSGEGKRTFLLGLSRLERAEKDKGGAREADGEPAASPGAAPGGLDTEDIDLEYCLKVAKAFADAAEGLQHAHQKGVVHRDLKPSNLILDREGRLRILDFGLARLEGQQALTMSGDFLGTPVYMSPEQAMAQRVRLDHRTDIYSLGATLYEMLTWHPPFQGKDYKDTLSQIIARDPLPPRRSNPRIPRDLETIVLKCLRKHPEERYGTAEAVAQDLRRFARGDPIEARPQASWEKAARRVWRLRWRILAAALVLFSLAAGSLLVRDRRLEIERRRDSLYRQQVLAAFTKLQLASLSDRAEGRQAISIGPCNLFALGKSRSFRGGSSIDRAIGDLEAVIAEFPGRPEAPYHLARALLLLGRKEEGRQVLEKGLAAQSRFKPLRILRELFLEGPSSGAAAAQGDAARPGIETAGWDDAYRLGYRAAVSGRWKDVVAVHTRILELNRKEGEPFLGSDLDALLGRGQAFLELEDYPAAIDDFTVAASQWPELLEPLLMKGKAHHLNGNRAFAEKVFEEAYGKAASPNDVAQVLVVLHGASLRDPEAALRWAGRIEDEAARETARAGCLCALSRWEEAEGPARRAVALDPDRALTHNQLGWSLLGQARLDEAAREIRRAITIDPGDALGHLRLGLVFKQETRFEEELVQCNKAIERDAEFADARVERGNVLNTLGRPEEARTEAETAIRLAPKAGDARCLLISTFAQMGNPEEAERQFQESIRLDPDCGPAYFWWGYALEEQGKTTEAMAMYRRAGTADRDGVMPWPHYSLACLLDREGRLEEALSECCRAIAINPNIGLFHDRFLSLYRRLPGSPAARGRLEGLKGRLGRMVDEAQVRPGILQTLALAWIHCEKPDISKAAALVERATDLFGRSPGALSVLAEARWLTGDRAVAVRILEEAVRAPGAARFLADQTGQYRRQLLPDLASYASIDAAPGPLEALIEPFRGVARGEDAALRLAYLEGLVLERGGKHGEAARKFKEVVCLDGKSPEPALRLAESLRAAGDAVAAERVLRAALASDAVSREVGELWAAVALADLGRDPVVLLGELRPGGLGGDSGQYREDLRWVLERLKAGEPIRIDCGGEGRTGPGGVVWGKDRFFLGGIGGDNERWFPEDDFRPAGYRVPLPGRYRIDLHFAERWYQARGLRQFNVRIEGQEVLKGYEPLQAGFAVEDTRSFKVEVKDGLLDLEFLPRAGRPMVSGVEIEKSSD